LAVTTPIYPKEKRPMPCPEEAMSMLKQKENNPYEITLAREVKNWFDHSQMIAVFHINPISGEDFFKARVALHKSGGMQLKKYGAAIMERALSDSNYEAISKLLVTKTFCTCLVFSPEHKKVSTLLKVVKKIPQLHLLGGIVDGRLLSKNEFTDYAKMPNIDIVRSQLANVLNLAGSQLVQNLQSHQTNLVNILEAHVRENSKTPADENVTPKSEES
jgi:large subunit ribosomal protein L10